MPIALLEGTGGDVKRLDRILADIERPDVVVPVLAQESTSTKMHASGLQPGPQIQRRIGWADAARRARPAR